MRHEPRAQKPSVELTSRLLLRRTRDLENVPASISQVQMGVHVIQGMRLNSKEEREANLREALGNELLLELPTKADLILPRFNLNKLRR